MRLSKISLSLFSAFVFAFPLCLSAATVSITEIMYDLPGNDSDREWIEVQNMGAEPLELSDWRLFEAGVNHRLTVVEGTSTLEPRKYAVIVEDPAGFKGDWPAFSGTIFDSSFSLKDAETIAIKDNEGKVADEVSYQSEWGGAGDGNSLQRMGEEWIAASPTPWEGASVERAGTQSADSQGSSDGLATTTAGTAASVGGSTQPPPPPPPPSYQGSGRGELSSEPQIIAEIFGEQIAVVSVPAIFRGEGRGLERRPLENARFIWNFGDGSFKEGRSLMHTWSFPGEYAVVLEVASAQWSASARLRVRVVSAKISIWSIEAGEQGFIELWNNSPHELNLTSWILSAGTTTFVFPAHTRILPSQKVKFALSVTGISGGVFPIRLLYPNGVIAHEYSSSSSTPTTLGVKIPRLSNEVVVSANSSKSPRTPVGGAKRAVDLENSLTFSSLGGGSQDTPNMVLGGGASVLAASPQYSPERESRKELLRPQLRWYLLLALVIILSLGALYIGRERKEKLSADNFTIIDE